ncbi:MAG: hypothetical protein SFX73_24605 [Kofleriaceae bacterium]|nr:hypothetical protein [Kofleriaceae bacterium]
MRQAMATAVLVLVSSPAVAQPKPPTLASDYVLDETIPIYDRTEKKHEHEKVRVTLHSAGKVAATETSTQTEQTVYSDELSTTETWQWANTWQGTWKQTGTALTLDLKLTGRTCTHTRKTTGMDGETLPCRPASKEVRFQCESIQLPRTSNPREQLDVWDCRSTLPQWILGKTTCVKRVAPRVAYEPC